MKYQRTVLLALMSLAASGLAFGQTPPATSPSSASSPAQRESTSSSATEAPATNGTDPADASSPHQQQATEGGTAGKAKHDQMMKDCVTKQQTNDAGMSKDQAKKACMDQMKMMHSDHPTTK
jgi:hypothetical protein